MTTGFEPVRADELPPADLGMIGMLDDRGEPIRHLYRLTMRSASGRALTFRFGASDPEDGRAGAREAARACGRWSAVHPHARGDSAGGRVDRSCGVRFTPTRVGTARSG